MGKTASEVQKERIKEIEDKANNLLEKCRVVTLASINEKGYPRICTITNVRNNGFSEMYFITSKRSHINGKATHFENNPKASVCYSLGSDTVSLIGEVEIVTDIREKMKFDDVCDRRYFKNGIADPKCYLLRFRPNEATFWIEGKFRTCKYKLNK